MWVAVAGESLLHGIVLSTYPYMFLRNAMQRLIIRTPRFSIYPEYLAAYSLLFNAII
jgi:hypothetical protein